MSRFFSSNPWFLDGAERVDEYGVVYRIPTSMWNTLRPSVSSTTRNKSVILKRVHINEATIHKKASNCTSSVPIFYGTFVFDGARYMAMEDLAGYHPLVQLNVMLYSKIIRVTRQLNRCGIIHGDLHFANILVKGTSLKIIDFGLSRFGYGNQENGESIKKLVSNRVSTAIGVKKLRDLKMWSRVQHNMRGNDMLLKGICVDWPRGVEYIIDSGLYKEKHLTPYMRKRMTPGVARVLTNRGLL